MSLSNQRYSHISSCEQSLQWCAGKLVFWGWGMHWFIVFANSLGVNIPSVEDFKLPYQSCSCKIPEYLTTSFYKRLWAITSCLKCLKLVIPASQNSFLTCLIWKIIHNGFLNQSCYWKYVPWEQGSLFAALLSSQCLEQHLAHRRFSVHICLWWWFWGSSLGLMRTATSVTC